LSWQQRGEPYLICQSFPELAVDERYDATWVFWCAAVVLAIVSYIVSSFNLLENGFPMSRNGKMGLPTSPVAATSFSILFHLPLWVSYCAVAYLPEATDVVLNIAWDPKIWEWHA
jgi:hypothetical protein